MKEVSLRATTSDQRERQKRSAADRAVDEVRSGMTLGLGAGSTARFTLARIAERIAEGCLSDIAGVPCSREVGEEAARLGFRLSTLDARPLVDLTIDEKRCGDE
jgi:ribose 5-phosphate isomerase A